MRLEVFWKRLKTSWRRLWNGKRIIKTVISLHTSLQNRASSLYGFKARPRNASYASWMRLEVFWKRLNTSWRRIGMVRE